MELYVCSPYMLLWHAQTQLYLYLVQENVGTSMLTECTGRQTHWAASLLPWRPQNVTLKYVTTTELWTKIKHQHRTILKVYRTYTTAVSLAAINPSKIKQELEIFTVLLGRLWNAPYQIHLSLGHPDYTRGEAVHIMEESTPPRENPIKKIITQFLSKIP
jgi:hypothetical protein